MHIQLGHPPGEMCHFRSVGMKKKFTIVHTNGIHIARVHFCKCKRNMHVPEFAQLLRWRLWPATDIDPESATTFEALDLFQRLSLIGKVNGYDFYRAIEATLDGALMRSLAVRLDSHHKA